jgi:hypothetical protein
MSETHGQDGRPESRRIVAQPFDNSPTRDPAVVKSWIEGLHGEGWIETHTELMPWRHGDPLPAGKVLAAESCEGPDSSVHILWNGREWTGVMLTEQPPTDGERVIEQSFVSTRTGGRWHMRYRTCWSKRERDDGVRVLEPSVSRFAGWHREE